jgi:hypothetical protein
MRVRTAVVAFLAVALSAGAPAAQSAVSLAQVLGIISHLDTASLISISFWASASNPQPPEMTLSDLDRAEVDTLALAPVQRDALLAWLNHGGRTKLYAVGATDAQIGPCQPDIDLRTCHVSASTQTAQSPSPAAAPASLGEITAVPLQIVAAPDASGIDLLGGFAAVQTTGAQFIHCVAFRNHTQKTGAAITFTYKLLASSGTVLEAGSDILVGSFPAGFHVDGPSTADELAAAQQSGRPLPSNCWSKTIDASGPSLKQLASVSIEVSSVTYEDGSHWSL